jgi:hypothetical protein
MTLLHTQFTSGNILTAGSDGGVTGVSGLNDMSARINFGLWPINHTSTIDLVFNSNENITQAVISGDIYSYQIDCTYNADQSPTVITISGGNIGSVITHNYFYQNGSGITSTGSLVAGSIVLS